MEREDLINRFKHHPPKDKSTADLHEQVRSEIGNAADFVNKFVPEGREKSLAITKLEEAMMWANAGIARNSS